MALAGALNIGKKNKNNELEYDYDIQGFENLPFRIKVETIEGQENVARLFFLDKYNDNRINVPDGIMCKDVTFKHNTGLIPPLPDTQYFLIVHPNIYNFYYDTQKKKCSKRTKIYSVNSQKKYLIHNYRKTSQVLEEERVKLINDNTSHSSL
ncbi:23809_t:CDS:2 [Gigaspora margarita]|uniref:23809_t:CDS:1 n=1 Tax=Gigaspora margarita TaxID=4874 RepID=A0ABN7VI79_GIGMA|nr:23809_t:CDS:2 [Gigaspora margarita]